MYDYAAYQMHSKMFDVIISFVTCEHEHFKGLFLFVIIQWIACSYNLHLFFMRLLKFNFFPPCLCIYIGQKQKQGLKLALPSGTFTRHTSHGLSYKSLVLAAWVSPSFHCHQHLLYTPFPHVNRQMPRLLSVWHANTWKSRALFFPGLSAGFRQSPAHENNFAHVQNTGCYSRDRTLNRDRLLASESWLRESFGKELLCVDDRHRLPF